MITAVPSVEFDRIPHTSNLSAVSSTAPTRLELYLTHLTLRPSNDSPAELFDDITELAARGPNSINPALTSSYISPSSYLPVPDPSSGSMVPSGGSANAASEEANSNPESDSFTYIETLLEALAVLGRLVGGLDTVIQRIPTEISALVDATIEEVGERSEFLRQGQNGPTSSASPNGNSRPLSMDGSSSSRYVFVERKQTDDLASSLRLTALEASAKPADQETLKDLFWTLFSKLDAVLQGFRVTYEVANRIGRVSRMNPCPLLIVRLPPHLTAERV